MVVPVAPKNASAAVGSSGSQVVLTWTMGGIPGGALTSYQPQERSGRFDTVRNTWESDVSRGQSYVGQQASFTGSGYTLNRRLQWRFRTEYGGDYSAYTYTGWLQTGPFAPTGCSVRLGGAPNTVQIDWTNTNDTSFGYVYDTTIEVRQNGGAWVQVDSVPGGPASSVTSSSRPIPSGGGTITYRVRAVSSVGGTSTSAYSTSNTITTDSPGPSLAKSTWYQAGGFSAFSAPSWNLSENALSLVVNSAVDTQAVTRIQYAGQISATAYMNFASDDGSFIVPGPSSGVRLTTQMVVVPASLVSASPSIAEIVNAAGYYGSVNTSQVYWQIATSDAQGATTHIPSQSAQMSLPVTGPYSGQLSAGMKYWAAVVPVAITNADYSLGRLGKPLAGDDKWPQSRAVSFWTNRSPNAPVITSPQSNAVVSAGSTVTLACDFNDDDAILGGSSAAYTDVSGIQVQYASATSPSGWSNMLFMKSDGVYENGWYISGSAFSGNEGPKNLALSGSVPIDCGPVAAAAGHGFLPAGSWRVRVRAFDWGVPYGELLPFNKDNSSTPDNAPAYNTSPWSSAVTITISAQVPPPVPTYPTAGAAVSEGVDTPLTWSYTNTHQPPYPQATRSVQIRKVGDTAWTSLASSDPSASSTYVVLPSDGSGLGYVLVSGNEYEWRVQVTDTDASESNWSESATFWVVPAPASGGEIPSPATSLEGAMLGCGTHRAFIYRRGGTTRVGEISGMSHVDWSRVRDDISTAQVQVSSWDLDCGNLLANLRTWAYELVIFRDNGFSEDRVWEGPITLLTYEVDKVTIEAKDVMGYVYRRIIKQPMSDTANGDTVTSRASRILQNALAPDDPNILAYLTVLARSDDAMEYRSTPEYSRTAFEEIDDMAANAGLDYTCTGRRIMLWGTKHSIGLLPELRDSDLGAPPIVSEYGMSLANHYAVSDGNGIYGDATRGGILVNGTEVSGSDPTYGLVEVLSSSWASDSEADVDTYTQEGIAKMQASFAAAAERSIASRYPAPVVVRIPDNTSLNPDTVVSIQQLVPGVAIPLRSTGTLRSVVGTQKLDSVKVVEEDGRETITITLSSFNSDDADAGSDQGEGA